MKIFNHFEIPNWQEYKELLLHFYYHNHDYDANSVADDKDHNFLKILRREKIKNLLPGLVEHFDSIGHHIVFLETVGMPPTDNPHSEIHKDSSPLFDDYFMANYAINFSLENTENSKIVFFDEDQKEITRLNYDHCPLLFRTNVWHSVVNYSDKLRLTASIRFEENVSMEKYL
jgi:hypothetical protein